MDNLSAARAFIGDSLAFHIVFALFGVGLPVAIAFVEWWSLRTDNPVLAGELRKAAKTLSHVAVLLAVAGVASGTLVAIQMSLLWAGLVDFGAKIIGLPFMLEGYAFLFEAIFLGFYVATWDKIYGYRHFLLIFPIIVGAIGSAVFITMVNAWMNVPGGFTLVNGELAEVQMWKGLLTWTALHEISHSVLAYLMATFFVVAGGYTWHAWKHRLSAEKKDVSLFLVKRFIILGLVCELAVAGIGHFTLMYMAESEPRKFAAIELVAHTTTHAPYIIGGEMSEDGSHVQGGIRIPNMLSILAGNTPSTQVPGLNDYPREEWPLLIVNKLFEVKMLLVGFTMAVPMLYLFFQYRFTRFARNKYLLAAVVALGPVSIVIIELGWMIVELGRQPFAVVGYLKTAEAFTKNPDVFQWGIAFPILFVLLTIVTVMALRRMLKFEEQQSDVT